LRKPRALLINPHVYDFALYDLFLRPYGLFRIAATLEAAGWETDYINALDYEFVDSTGSLKKPRRKPDGTGKFLRAVQPMPKILRDYAPENYRRRFARYGIPPEELLRRLPDSPPDIIFISSSMTYWYKGVQEAAQLAGELYRSVPLVVGGSYATLMPDHSRRHTGARIVSGSLDKAGLDAILRSAGLPGSGGSGPLDPPSGRRTLWGEAGVLRLNEGCPYSCEYCASRALSPRFLPGDAEAAFALFDRMAQGGLKNFAFYDDALLVRKEECLLPFLEKVMASGRPASFYTPNAVHLDMLDIGTARLMKKAGFREIRLGYESASNDFHDSYGQKYREGGLAEAVGMLKQAGFESGEIGVYILAGLPRQEAGEVRDSVEEARKAGVRIFIAEYSPVPGSALWDRCTAESRLPLAEEPLFHNNSFFPMEWERFSRKELDDLKAEVREANRSIR
jgi:radical SAM superfamily enzyme YgiQ (UPF0313 family)